MSRSPRAYQIDSFTASEADELVRFRGRSRLWASPKPELVTSSFIMPYFSPAKRHISEQLHSVLTC
jgi:hypothetical protein